MGIKGLFKRLAEWSTDPFPQSETIEKNSVLLLDGCGFVFFLLEKGTQKYHKIKVDRSKAGDYLGLDELIRAEFKRLQSLGFNIEVFIDGASTHLKTDTISKRKHQRMESSYLHYQYVNGTNGVNVDQLPLPILAMEQFHCTLTAINRNSKLQPIKVVHCKFEADQEMALTCVRGNLMGIKHYCCSGDSDFIAFKDCPFIKFHALMVSIDEMNSVEDGCVTMNVFKRATVASKLGLSEMQFVEMCILMGNDYTGGFDRTLSDIYDGEADFSIFNSNGFVELVDMIKRKVHADRPTGRPSSKNAALQLAMDYSRVLYDLGDLSPFQIEANISGVNEQEEEKIKSEDEDVDEEGTSLSVRQQCLLDEYVESNLSELIKKLRLGIDFSVIAVSVIQDLKCSSSCRLFDSIDYAQLNALKKTGEILLEACVQNGKRANSNQIRQKIADKISFDKTIAHRPAKLEWADIVAANQYQLILSYLAMAIEDMADSVNTNFDFPMLMVPLLVYDGNLFHHLMGAEAIPLELKIGELKIDFNSKPVKGKVGNTTLPIDAYKAEILRKIDSDRVVIIHGETGCGKSSRIPLFIYEDAQLRRKKCRFMVSQPRRIAAKSLKDRLHETLGNVVGLRMGHGYKEESPDTLIHFCTTGYIVRLLANVPEFFNRHTHLIIDEVHERSVDGDLLCYLVRRLLTENSRIRVILMSATIHTDLYSKYFGPEANEGRNYGDLQCLSVGVKRFPLEVKFMEEIAKEKGLMKYNADFIIKECSSILKSIDALNRRSRPDDNVEVDQQPCLSTEEVQRVMAAPSGSMISAQYRLIVEIVNKKVEFGTGVLIFVAGIEEIQELQQMFEGNKYYRIVVIHSDVPFDEQQQAFVPAGFTEKKIILATNAAESSITLPDVDIVICMGTHKTTYYDAIKFQDTQHNANRAVLVKAWISKASATQRAGRTARTGPGTCYRLYSRGVFEYMEDHQKAEIFRRPLHDIVLTLKTIFTSADDENESGLVVPILNDLIEPPVLSSVMASFNTLYDAQMINAPIDGSPLTVLGKFAGQLPTDLLLSRMIAIGLSLGIGSEAIILAAALSQATTVFRRASPFVHDCDEYIEIVKKIYLAQVHLDNGIYSEPIMMLKLFIMFYSVRMQSSGDHLARKLCLKYGIMWNRMNHFMSAATNLLRNVNNSLIYDQGRATRHLKCSALDFGKMLSMPKEVVRNIDDNNCGVPFSTELLTTFRLILTWTSAENTLCLREPKKNKSKCFDTVEVVNEHFHLSASQLDKMFLLNKVNDKVEPNPANTSVQWKSVKHFRSTYEGTFNETRNTSDLHDLHCSLFYNNETIEGEDKSWFDEFGVKLTIVVKQESKKKVENISIAVLTSVCNVHSAKNDGMNEQLSIWKTLLYSEFKEERLLYAGHQDYFDGIETTHNLHLFILQSPSNQEISVFKIFVENCTYSLAMLTIAVSKNPILRLINVAASNLYLVNIFHKRSSVLQVKVDKFGSLLSVTTSNGVITRTGQESGGQVLQFFDSEFNANASTVPPLFKDFALGVRLLIAYSGGYWKRLLKVFCNGTENVGKANVVVGSAKWKENKMKEALKKTKPVVVEDDFADDDEEVDSEGRIVVKHTAVSLLPISSINLLASKENWKGDVLKELPIATAILPKHTVIGTARSCGPTKSSLYGVAYGTMAINSISGGVACSGVTLLPLGDTFVSMALSCVSQKLKDSVVRPNRAAKHQDACDEIRDYLIDMKDNPVCFDSDFQELVKETFRECNWFEI